MNLRTLKKQCKWEDIEVGEVFAWNGCWRIYYKISSQKAICLAEDEILDPDIHNFDFLCLDHTGAISAQWFLKLCGQFYKLPKSIQKWWKQDK